ncbi:armadillo-type protein [Chytriomyces sp. MP71]|nr:armadillo-type protein [Chytriomyces sp. MP71]
MPPKSSDKQHTKLAKKAKKAAPKEEDEHDAMQVDAGIFDEPPVAEAVDDDEAGDWGNGDLEEAEGDGEAEGAEAGGQEHEAKQKDEEKQRASRQEQKQLLKERKNARPNGALVLQLKRLWEVIRQKAVSSELRQEKMAELMGLITGKIQEVTFRHDAARVIQSALKHGSSAQREIIAEELRGKYATLACSQYGRFIVSKILNMCPKHRALVLKEFEGQVRKLMRHRDAAFVIEEAYSQFANAAQRNSLMEEFYGPEYALFKGEKAKTLAAILTENPSKKAAITKNMRETISSFLEKSAANIGPHTILHRLILDYLLLLPAPTSAAAATPSSDAATVPAGSSSAYMVDLLKDHLIHILHTREGARVAQLTLLHASPKDRKHILKTFKGLVPKIAKEPFGHTVLISVCECVDDTVLTGKTVLAELVKAGAAGDGGGVVNPGELLRDPYASRVVLYLLTGRSKRYMSSFVLEELEAMDAVRKVTSKKADDVRRKEIVGHLSSFWLELAAQFAGELVRSKSGGQVLVELLKHAEGDKSPLITAIASQAAGTIETYKSSIAAVEPAKKEVFNAAKKLAADAKAEKAAKAAVAAADGKESGDEPDMMQHALVNRNATFTLKEMIAGRPVGRGKDAEVAEPLNASRATVALAIAEQIAPEFEYWLRYCAGDVKTSGTTFVLLALMESADDVVSKALVGSNDKRKKKYGKLVAELETLAAKTKASAAANAPAGSNGKSSVKRKRQEDEKPGSKKEEGAARDSVIQIFLKKLKETF